MMRQVQTDAIDSASRRDSDRLSIHPSIYQQWSPDTPVKASAFAICITGEARVVTRQGL